jgi:LysM repeat protein
VGFLSIVIAKHFNTTVNELKKLNNIEGTGDQIDVNQKVIIQKISTEIDLESKGKREMQKFELLQEQQVVDPVTGQRKSIKETIPEL